MKKVFKIATAGITVLALTGCGYTQEDADQVKNIIMEAGGHVQTDESNARLDANLDGFITPADYVLIKQELKKANQ